MSEEEKKAIEALKGCIIFWQKEYIKNTIKEDESSILAEIAINQTLLNLIEKQQKEIENSVSKDKVKELKEKVHKTLDANGITRAYQMLTDKDFEELLEE